MTNSVKSATKGDWVEVWEIVLKEGERAPQVPEDTQKVPLEMRLRGFLLDEGAREGERVRIKTRIGREVEGFLKDVSPLYAHNFGTPQTELLAIGQELRTLLREGEAERR